MLRPRNGRTADHNITTGVVLNGTSGVVLNGTSQISSKAFEKSHFMTNNNCVEFVKGQETQQSEMGPPRSSTCGSLMDYDSNSSPFCKKIRTTKMTILTVFGKEDAQTDTLKKAADKGCYKMMMAKSFETAEESFKEHQQDLVIIDCRHSKYFDYEKLCRSMKSIHPRGHSRFLALVTKSEPSIIPFLNAGYTRRLAESTNVTTCYNELMSIEVGELKAYQYLRLLNPMYQAVQNVSESVELVDSKLRTEYVNGAFEKLTGFVANEVVGVDDIQSRLQVDNCNEEQLLTYHMQQEKTWEGTQTVKKKNGDTVQCRCRVVPVEFSQGKPSRHIIVRSTIPMSESQHFSNSHMERFRNTESRSPAFCFKRRESHGRYGPMTIEAPITKVISMLYDAQANSPNMGVVQALETVVDILQTTELFAPHIHRIEEVDPLTNDYVGGLMTNSDRTQSRQGLAHKPNLPKYRSSGLRPHTTSSTYAFTPEVLDLLRDNASWDFDIIKLESLTHKNALVPLGMKVFERFNAMELLDVDEKVMANWLQLIGDKYHSANPYHNATHAGDVLQATAYFLEKLRPRKMLDAQEEVAALIAAVIHDVDHPAKTTKFLISTKDKLALLYNDMAVLENHHASTGFLLTQKHDSSNIFKNLNEDTYKSMRYNIIEMVLATELVKHFEHLQRFAHLCKPPKAEEGKSTTSLESLVQSVQSGNEPIIAEHSVLDQGLPILVCDQLITVVGQPIIMDQSSIENRRTVLRMVIKCADVSNPARSQELMVTWANRITDEYFEQTDEEHRLNLQCAMPHFDRATCSIPDTQTTFIKVFLSDMFALWNVYLDIPEVYKHLYDNYQYWKSAESNRKPENDGGTAKRVIENGEIVKEDDEHFQSVNSDALNNQTVH